MVNKKNLFIWLNHLGGISYENIQQLTNYFGSLEELWYAGEEHILKAMGSRSIIADKLLKNRNEKVLRSNLTVMENKNFDVVTILDDTYPEKLKNIYNPPYVLYIKGSFKGDIPLIGLVGARKSTAYGKWAARKFAKELSDWGIGIVSGLALGVDRESHIGSLESNGYTIGVIGCGIDMCYPKSNQQLYNEMIEKGCIVSEYPPGTEPLKHHFPARNRIISGLSDGIVVIEAGIKSGALITVEHGLEQGKDIYALPGNINSSQSKGTNKIIKEGGKILLEVEDIIEELKCRYPLENSNEVSTMEEALSEEEIRIFKVVKEAPIHIDLLAYKSRISISELSTILTILEIKGFVSQLPGKTFTANR
ncbi:MAG: DNA-processing protein DprA [Clostridiaceae bacterium]|nr:DNA-processing protein DprA [Clostridiaceae bacterium]